MKNTYTPEQVRLCCTAYANGQSIATLSQDVGIPRSTIYTWIKREQEKAKQEKKSPSSMDDKDFLDFFASLKKSEDEKK
jgi:transposase